MVPHTNFFLCKLNLEKKVNITASESLCIKFKGVRTKQFPLIADPSRKLE